MILVSNSGTTPEDMLAGRRERIHAERDRKLEAARSRHRLRRRRVP